MPGFRPFPFAADLTGIKKEVIVKNDDYKVDIEVVEKKSRRKKKSE